MDNSSTVAIHVETPVGPATLQALFALVDRLEAVAAADPDVRILLDETDFDYAGVGREEVEQVGARWQETRHARHVQLAVVAPTDVVFGINRMAVSYAHAEENIRVFRTRAEAAAWLRRGDV